MNKPLLFCVLVCVFSVDWLAHVLVILLPLCYFAIFLVVNKHKEKLPCVARWRASIEKKPKAVIGGEDDADALPLHGAEDVEKA